MFQTSVFMKTTTNLVFFQGQPRKLIMALDAVRKQLPALAIMQHTPKCYRSIPVSVNDVVIARETLLRYPKLAELEWGMGEDGLWV